MSKHDQFQIKRIEYNNTWGEVEKILFESEKQIMSKLREMELKQIITPVKFNKASFNTEESTSLCYILEMLDTLPLRPDHGFDIIWKQLDFYSDILKKEYETQSQKEYKEARIKLIYQEINGKEDIKNEFNLFIEKISKIIPLTTCKFIAKRIYEHRKNYIELSEKQKKERSPAKTFETRLIASIDQKDFIDIIYNKYFNSFDTPDAKTIRNLGILIQKLIYGEENLKINSKEYKIINLENFISLVICTQYRNERAHGDVSPPFRRSTANLDTYSTPYLLMIYSYYSLIFLLWSRNQEIFDIENIRKSIAKTLNSFEKIFSKSIYKGSSKCQNV